jgi:hypothetical protein
MLFEKQVFWTIKIHPNDLIMSNTGGKLDSKSFSPTHIWVNGGDFDSNNFKSSRSQSDDGSFILAGSDGFLEAVELIVMANRLRLGFQRTNGGIDATTEAVLVSGPADIERQERIGRCVSDLARNIRSQM